MCDKKNSVLFNDTQCIVLSPNFKLIDESEVLLRVPRKNNMYSVDLKNIVPKGGLTCLFVKTTSDESKLWHRRLGHSNFKTMNKLVKGNLVRGFPSKIFENVETCVACQKEKQHRASCAFSSAYEIFHGRTPALSFMKLYGCPVTILNTLDHLGKFDGKADEGFFVGYSLSSKAFRVFNSRKRIVEENLHIRFSENTPNVVGSGLYWLFDIDALTRTMNYEPIAADPKDSQDDGFQPSSGSEKNVNEDPSKGSECIDQEQDDNVNSTNNVNAASTNRVNAVSENISNELLFDPNMLALEDISTFNFSSDHEDDDEEVDMNNMDTTIQVSHIPTTRIHKYHPLSQVIGDLHSTTQTRNTSKNLDEHGFASSIHQRTNHKDLQNYLFACFLSQEEPRKVIYALKDLSWIEAIQEELLQFKLQEVCTLVDLPNRKRAIALNGSSGTQRMKEVL
nr:putative ribonuclease H-like domain-containing protein [Tanacetum cinerariifolium]